MATGRPRNYSKLTIKRLYALSANRCSFPNCAVTFLNAEDDTNLSNICHIEDANPTTHKSDRYNINMTDEQRSDYKNLILLCPNHHIETNDPSKYTVDALKAMKRNHESKMALLQDGKPSISKYSSALSDIVNAVGGFIINISPDNPATIAPNTDEKINYNNITSYKPIIEEYSVYQGKLNGIYEEIEKQGSTKKEFLLQNIRMLYLKEKGNYNNIDEIRKNADRILENIENSIWNILENSTNLNTNLPIESIKIAILIVIVDSFMRCKILEEPVI